MCVIVIKPAGVEMPSKDHLKKCWADNPDGAGFSITRKGSTETFVEKGFLTFKHFYKYLCRYVESNEDLVIMHFRWATHGYRSAGHTHPFPVAKSRSVLEKTKYTSNVVVFHNGIIKMKNQPPTWSDTMYYVGGVMAYMNPLDIDLIMRHTKGSRMCIVQDGKPILLGDGWKEDEGLFYSNLGWKNSKRKIVTYGGVNTGSTFAEMSDEEHEANLRSILRKSGEVKKPYEN
jgi:hypothetical protein